MIRAALPRIALIAALHAAASRPAFAVQLLPPSGTNNFLVFTEQGAAGAPDLFTVLDVSQAIGVTGTLLTPVISFPLSYPVAQTFHRRAFQAPEAPEIATFADDTTVLPVFLVPERDPATGTCYVQSVDFRTGTLVIWPPVQVGPTGVPGVNAPAIAYDLLANPSQQDVYVTTVARYRALSMTTLQVHCKVGAAPVVNATVTHSEGPSPLVSRCVIDPITSRLVVPRRHGIDLVQTPGFTITNSIATPLDPLGAPMLVATNPSAAFLPPAGAGLSFNVLVGLIRDLPPGTTRRFHGYLAIDGATGTATSGNFNALGVTPAGAPWTLAAGFHELAVYPSFFGFPGCACFLLADPADLKGGNPGTTGRVGVLTHNAGVVTPTALPTVNGSPFGNADSFIADPLAFHTRTSAGDRLTMIGQPQLTAPLVASTSVLLGGRVNCTGTDRPLLLPSAFGSGRVATFFTAASGFALTQQFGWIAGLPAPPILLPAPLSTLTSLTPADVRCLPNRHVSSFLGALPVCNSGFNEGSDFLGVATGIAVGGFVLYLSPPKTPISNLGLQLGLPVDPTTIPLFTARRCNYNFAFGSPAAPVSVFPGDMPIGTTRFGLVTVADAATPSGSSPCAYIASFGLCTSEVLSY